MARKESVVSEQLKTGIAVVTVICMFIIVIGLGMAAAERKMGTDEKLCREKYKSIGRTAYDRNIGCLVEHDKVFVPVNL